jgi:hypothetical protein
MAPIVSKVLLNDLAHTLVWALDFMCSVFVTAMFKFWQHHMHLFYGVFLICTMLDCSPRPLWGTCFFFYLSVLLSNFFPQLFVAFGIYFVSDFYSVLVWVVLFVVWSCIVSCFSTLIPIVFFSHSHLNRESFCWNTGFLKYIYMQTLKWLHWIFLHPVFLQAVYNFHT